jgi:RecF/RecN/SMC N terminal domain
MIKIESIKIEEFRGIRDLTINIGGRNFAACGPNGTGKSGIVDALEFGLTGNISRLSGKGRGSLSVKEHGPHVNIRLAPEKAIITLEVSIPSIGKNARITRNVKAPRRPLIIPDEPEIRAAFEYAEHHPEVALSRREIIKYVLAEPGERAKEIQALLQLDALETTRALLLRISNACEREVAPLERHRDAAGERLMQALGIAELKPRTFLQAVNAKRAVLDLPPLSRLEPTTSIRDGLEAPAATTLTRLHKAAAKGDVAAAKAALEKLDSVEARDACNKALEALNKLKDNEAYLADISRDGMLVTALDLFDDQHCPVCQTSWEPEKFRATVIGQRQLLVNASRERHHVEASIAPLVSILDALPPLIAPLHTYAKNFPTRIETGSLVALSQEVGRRATVARTLLPLDQTIAAFTLNINEVGPAARTLAEMAEAVEALPDPTDRDAARDYLTVGQERLETWRGAALKYVAAKKKAEIAKRVHGIYSHTCDRALEAIYKEVETEFRTFYRAINGEDEGQFQAQLIPSLGKLGFEVDFYGKGFFPPGAYHSEGHQDGMGLCLYLALMRHLFGDRFTLAVLDDVLMSVDAAHRREVCTLIKTQFPNTQFILTTHDAVWLNHMRTSNLIEGKHAIIFRKWEVDQGPSEWKDADVWGEIDGLVAKNEIRAAAAQMRYYFEYLAGEWCARLGGRVEFRGDAKYDLGELLPAAVAAMNKLLAKATAAANSWNDTNRVAELTSHKTAFSQVVRESNVEQWQINPAVHFNEWINLQRQDFEPVVAAFKDLERQFRCQHCGNPLYLVRDGAQKDSVRCACSKVLLNLREKPRPTPIGLLLRPT